jgi:DNA-binding transcriptional LysR family regulator
VGVNLCPLRISPARLLLPLKPDIARRAHLLTTGDFLTTMPKSMLKLNPECRGLQELPTTLPSPSFPVVLVTLKGRTLTPPAELFLDGLREHVRELGL